MNNNNIMNENAVNAIKEKYLKGNKAKLTMAKIATAVMIITALMFSQFSGAPLLNMKPGNWVHDKAGVLSDATINAINQHNAALSSLTGAEIVVAVEKRNDRDLIRRAEKLFKDYKVSDNGILFLVSASGNASVPNKPDRPDKPDKPSKNAVEEWAESIGEFFSNLFGGDRYSYAYYIGRNVDYSIREQIEGIFENNFYENYAAANYNAAVLDTFDAFLKYFEGYHNISASDHANTAIANSSPSFFTLTRSVLGVVVILGLALILVGIFSGRKNKKVQRVYRSPSWFGKVSGFDK